MDKTEIKALNDSQIGWLIDTLREELEERWRGESHDEGAAEAYETVKSELESAIESAEDEGAPAEGTAEDWGKDDLKGLRSFLAYLEANYL